MQALLALAFMIPLPFWRPAAERTDPKAWARLVDAFHRQGIEVRSDHPRCNERDLYGLYVRGSRVVVVCDRGDRSATLRHEGWHLVQSLCLQDQAWLRPDDIAKRLSSKDRAELTALVQSDRWQREAEARVMAALKPDNYLNELEKACGDSQRSLSIPSKRGETE
jgi:hypothetical protein